MRFAYTNFVSTNWKSLVDFYIKTFSCKIIPPIRNQSGEWLDKGTGLKNAKLEGAHLLLPGHGQNGPTLEIYEYENIENQNFISPNKKGFGHITFEVGSVEIILEKLIKNGGKFNGEVTKRKVEGVGEVIFVCARDPEGNLIEMQSWK